MNCYNSKVCDWKSGVHYVDPHLVYPAIEEKTANLPSFTLSVRPQLTPGPPPVDAKLMDDLLHFGSGRRSHLSQNLDIERVSIRPQSLLFSTHFHTLPGGLFTYDVPPWTPSPLSLSHSHNLSILSSAFEPTPLRPQCGCHI